MLRALLASTLSLWLTAIPAPAAFQGAQDPLKDAGQAFAVAVRTDVNFKAALDRVAKIGTVAALEVLIREFPVLDHRAEQADLDARMRREDLEHRRRRLQAAKAAKEEKRVALIQSDLGQRESELTKAEKEAGSRKEARDQTLEAIRVVLGQQPEAAKKTALQRFERGFQAKLEESERGPLFMLFAGLGQPGSVARLVTAMVEAARRKKEVEKPLDALTRDEAKVRAKWAEAEAAPNSASPQARAQLQAAWQKACADLQAVHVKVHVVAGTIAAAARAIPVAIAAEPEAERKHEVDETVRGLQRLTGEERSALMAELGKVREPSLLPALRALVSAPKDPGQLCFALRALGEAQDEELLKLAPAPLTHADWTVRAAAIEGLRLLRKAPAIPLLIDTLAREDGRLKDDAVSALRVLTGKNFNYEDKLWREWWDKEGAGFEVPRPVEGGALESGASGPSGGVTFYGIQTSSKNVLFVIDISRSMTFDPDAADQEEPPQGKPDRMTIAKEQLVTALKGLREGGVFNIVWFSTEVGAFRKTLVPTTTENLEAAVKYVNNELKPIAGTNLYGGLREAFNVAGIGATDRYYQTRIDTMFLLTDVDGFEDARRIQGEVTDPDQLLDFVKERNRLNRITVHTIGIGTKQTAYFLKRLATENGGQYQAR